MRISVPPDVYPQRIWSDAGLYHLCLDGAVIYTWPGGGLYAGSDTGDPNRGGGGPEESGTPAEGYQRY